MNPPTPPPEPALAPPSNPILQRSIRAVKPDDFSAPHVFRTEATGKRDLMRLFRQQTAKEFVGTVTPAMHIFGFSKGQFSLVDIIREVSDQIGPCHLALSTWTVAHADLSELESMVAGDRFKTLRFLLDFSFQRRQPALIQRIRQRFGPEAVVVTRNHAKFCLFKTEALHLVRRTSMNLNFNPRLEDVELKEDAELFAFIETILDDIFAAHDKKAQKHKTTAELASEFQGLRL